MVVKWHFICCLRALVVGWQAAKGKMEFSLRTIVQRLNKVRHVATLAYYVCLRCSFLLLFSLHVSDCKMAIMPSML
jgi:hypothetical protein